MQAPHNPIQAGHCLLGLIMVISVLSGCSRTLQHDASLALVDRFEQQNFQHPVAMLQAPGDGGNWFVVEQPGRVVRLTLDGQREVYIDITDRVDSKANEAGLLGMAFHPDFVNNGEVFLSYTRAGAPLVSYVSRFLLDKSTNQLKADSEQIILILDQPYSNHNGGQIGFDLNGNLLIGFGDGGSGGDPQHNGQNPRNLLGALLRLDINHGSPYTIPADNPFADGKSGAPEVYAYGLRNPWRWSFDRKNGELWVADVGQGNWEEIDRVTAGGNYGWNLREGKHCYNSESCDASNLIDPVAEYSHAEGCSITGGYVYRGKALADLVGRYLYADFCSGKIWALQNTGENTYQSTLLLDSNLNISSFAEDNDGELYVMDYGNGRVLRLAAGN